MNKTGINDMTTSQPMVSYDAAVIEKMAKGLLDRANMLVALYTLFGILLGLLLRAGVSEVMLGGGILGWLGLFLAAGIGYAIGNGRAFALRSQAHLLLCQVSIERNTARLLAFTGYAKQ